MSSEYSDPLVDYPAVEPRFTTRKILAYTAKFTAIGLVLFFLFSVIWVMVYRFTQPPSSFIMRRDRQQGIELDRRPVPIQSISQNLAMAVIASEDQLFCQHNGFDWTAIAKARVYNEEEERTRGASTISMQTAKNAFLWPTRSWIRKGFEAYFTALIEVMWPKTRIMEVYLNLAEWDMGVYGAEAAAQHYFGISARELSSYQAALLAAALPTPTRSNPGSPSEYLSIRASEIENDMLSLPPGYGVCIRY